MREIKVRIGIMREGIKEAKRIWELRRKDPMLWYFLTNCNYLKTFFQTIIKRDKLITTKKALDQGIYGRNFFMKNKSESHGEIMPIHIGEEEDSK